MLRYEDIYSGTAMNDSLKDIYSNEYANKLIGLRFLLTFVNIFCKHFHLGMKMTHVLIYNINDLKMGNWGKTLLVFLLYSWEPCVNILGDPTKTN